jgi:hypothetical protein
MRAHRIDRQVIELHCGSEEKVGILRHALTNFILPELEKVMGKVLDEISGSDAGWYRVDRLELDLGELTLEEWTDGEEVLRRFEYRMRERVKEWFSEDVLTRALAGVSLGVSAEAGAGIAGGAAATKGLIRLKGLDGLKGPGGLGEPGRKAEPGEKGGDEPKGEVGGNGGPGGKGMPGRLGGVGMPGGVRMPGGVGGTGGSETEEKQGSQEIGGIGLLAEIGLEWEMVRSFLLSGQLPWWADRQSLPDMDILMRRVAGGMPERMRAWMAEAGNVAVWQRVGGFSTETRRLVNEIAGDVGLPDAAMVMEELVKILAGRDPEGDRFEVIRAVVQERRAGFLRWLLRLVGTGSAGKQAEVLMEVEAVRKRFLERPVLMAMLLLYVPGEVMKREVRRILGGESVGEFGGRVLGGGGKDLAAGSGDAVAMGGEDGKLGGAEAAGDREEVVKSAGIAGRIEGEQEGIVGQIEGEAGRTTGIGETGKLGETERKLQMGGSSEKGVRDEMGKIDEMRGMDEIGEMGGDVSAAAVVAGERRRWFTLKAAERSLLEEIVKRRSADSAGAERLLAKTIKKITVVRLKSGLKNKGWPRRTTPFG